MATTERWSVKQGLLVAEGAEGADSGEFAKCIYDHWVGEGGGVRRFRVSVLD